MDRKWISVGAVFLAFTVAVAPHCGRPGGRDAEALHLRGQALIRMGMTEEALGTLESAIALEPGRYELLETYWELRFKREEGAVDEVARLEQEKPDQPLYPRLLCALHPDPSRRVEAGRRALKLTRGEPEILLSLGDAFSAAGEADSAGHYYSRALEIDPAMSSASLALAGLKAEQGDKVAAEAIYRGLIHPGSGVDGYDDAARELFELLWDEKDPSEAIAVARSCRTRLKDPWVPNDMALKMADARIELALAESLALSAMEGMQAAWIESENPEIDPKWAESTARRYRGYIYDTLGFVYLQAGKNQRAVDAFEKAVSSIPYVDSEVQIKLARAYRDLGQVDRAIEALLDVVAISLNQEAMGQLEACYVEKTGNRSGLDDLVAERRRGAVRPSTDFRMTSLTGEAVSLSNFQGKVVLLNFWFPT